jgi:heterodisulfide reductase subunit D
LARAPSAEKVQEIIQRTAAYLCIDCSKCTGSCPIGKAGSVYSPRALVQHLMLEGRDPSDTDLWRCLTCGLCKERCPANVDFPGFIHALREIAFAGGGRPQDTHGGTLKQMMGLMANPHIRQKRTDWLPDWVQVLDDREEKDKSDDLYFVGCAPYFDLIFEDFDLDLKATHEGALEFLRLCGVTPAVLANERCCGHDALWTGDRALFAKLARLNVELFRKAGAKRVFVSCPEGYHTFTHHYKDYLGDVDIEFVNTLKFLADEGPALDGIEGETRVTYHDSCRMGRFSGLYEEPRKIIADAGGLTLTEMEFSREQAPCCGSNLWVACDAISKRMQYELLDAAHSTGAEILLTACDKCRIHLACAQMEKGSVGDHIRTESILGFLHRKGVRKS